MGMTRSTASRQPRFVAASRKADDRTDVELLHLFVHKRDEQAFATLVRRHAAIVWGVCMRVLRNAADAEDALQATFLRLAKNACRIVNREALAGWLNRVARDCSIDLRRTILRQRRLEARLAAVATRVASEAPLADLRVILEDELALLPMSDRTVLILVCLDGRTYSDAANELGCSIAAVHRRLVRAQSRLRRRLSPNRRKSITLLQGGLAVVLTPDSSAGSSRIAASGADSRTPAKRRFCST
jgi:RNA polymerase sigma factor (sigma-70 family)